AAEGSGSEVVRHVGRPLGRRHARRRHDRLQRLHAPRHGRPSALRRAAPGADLPSHRPRSSRVHGDDPRSGDVRETVDERADVHPRQRRPDRVLVRGEQQGSPRRAHQDVDAAAAEAEEAVIAIGFVGFGEAGSTIAKGLRSAGADRIAAFDINAHDARCGPLIRQRAAESGTTLVDSSLTLARASDLVLSTVTSSAALDAAGQTAPFLKPAHLFADLNSVSPARKQEIAAVIDESGARFVEIAVMAPVAPYGHKVPMLAGGGAARAFADAMAPSGMRIDVLDGARVGAAAAVKMCRSIVVKGLEALMCECVLGATRYGADEMVFRSLNESFPGLDWKKLADYMVGRVVVHGE